jgi:hypothetical protein
MARKLNSRGDFKGLFARRRRSRAAGAGEGSGGSDYRKQIRAKKATGKNGCSQKLFMLTLPLIAVGAYLLLVS